MIVEGKEYRVVTSFAYHCLVLRRGTEEVIYDLKTEKVVIRYLRK